MTPDASAPWDRQAQPDQLAQLHAALVAAARTRLVDAARQLSATDLHVLFTAEPQGPLTATGQVTGGGRSLCFCEAELHDPQGQLVARAMGSFRYR